MASIRNSELDPLVDFIFETGQLKKVPRSGWLKLGVDRAESVADHSFRTAIIGYILALAEGVDPCKVITCCLFHDLAEARTLDLDWVAQNYSRNSDYLDSEVLSEQLSLLPENIAGDLRKMMRKEASTEEVRMIVKDADKLEAAFQAMEYYSRGHTQAEEWVRNSIDLIQSETGTALANKLITALEDDQVSQLVKWWEGLSHR